MSDLRAKYPAAVLLVTLASLALGYRTGTSTREAGLRKTASNPTDEANQAIAESLTQVLSAILRKDPKAGAPSTKTLEVEAALDRVERSAEENRLYRDLGDDAVGARIRRSLISQRHREVPGVDQYAQSFAMELAHDPMGTETVKTALGRIPASDFPLERVALLSALAANPQNAGAVKALALGELTQNPPDPRPLPGAASTADEMDAALSTTPAQTRPIVAQSLFLKTAQDGAEALSGTVEGIAVQQDWGIRSTLAMQFLQTYPDMGGQLKTALSSRGIALQVGAPGSQQSQGD